MTRALTEFQALAFDCYGTLIDWETGVYEAFQKEADRDGFTIDREALIPRFIDVQREIQRGSYELYAEVLRRTAVKVAKEIGWELEPSRAQFVPDSVARWQPFRESNAAMDRLLKALVGENASEATRESFRQRIVENAMKHAIERAGGHGTIAVQASPRRSAPGWPIRSCWKGTRSS